MVPEFVAEIFASDFVAGTSFRRSDVSLRGDFNRSFEFCIEKHIFFVVVVVVDVVVRGHFQLFYLLLVVVS